MVHSLRPPTLDEFGLLGSIQSRINEIMKTQQMISTKDIAPIQVQLNAPNELPYMPAAVEVAAYRIVTESLVNVIRHANATSCSVHIYVNDVRDLQVEVIDNGIFPLAKSLPVIVELV
jgi:signal transduction histidine kinase